MSQERDWTGKAAPVMERRSRLSKLFDAKDWTVELVPYRLADVTFSWSGFATHKTTGEVKEFGPYRTKDGDAYRAIVEFSAGAFGNLREVKPGDSEREQQDRQMLQAALDSGEPLTVSMRNRIAQLGLTKTEPAAPTNGQNGRFSKEDDAVYTVFCYSKPETMLPLAESHPHRAGSLLKVKHNGEVHAAYFNHRPDLPVTIENLEVAYRTLDEMGCIEKLNTRHRAQGPIFGGRAYDYDPSRDPSFKRQRTYTEAELAAARRKLVFAGFPEKSSITKEQAIQVLGDADLVEALAAEATRQ